MDDIDQYRSSNQSTEALSAKEAAEWLGVKLPTLYAYTSRGLIRSVPGPQGRARRYLKADLERLKARKAARAGHGPVAAGALRFGEPVLETSICAISPEEGPLYRGHAALELARSDTPFELVAELLWSGELPPEDASQRTLYFWSALGFGASAERLRALLPEDTPPISLLAAVVPVLAAGDRGRFVERREAVLPRARQLVCRLASSLALHRSTADFDRALRTDGVAASLAAAFGADADATPILNRALVLCADHELNASAFAARVAASTGADIYSCIQAALAALSGPRHGGATERVAAFLEQLEGPDDVEQAIFDRDRRGESLEGFGHPLYPDGDPRGAALLDWARQAPHPSPALETCLALAEAMDREGRGGPTLDVGLVALCLSLDLPPGSPLALFAIARSAGWIAHTLEQYEAGYTLRPRATYKP